LKFGCGPSLLHILDEIRPIWDHMLEWQQRDMRQTLIVYLFPLLPKVLHDVVDLDGIRIEGSVPLTGDGRDRHKHA
jgi:hypothetical protein